MQHVKSNSIYQIKEKCLATLISLCFFYGISNSCYGQTLAERLSVQFETSYNYYNEYNANNVASISLGSEAKVWLRKNLSAGLRLNVGVASLGDNNYFVFQNIVPGSIGFSISEPKLKSLSSLSLRTYYEVKAGKSRLFLGFGLGRFFANPTTHQVYYTGISTTYKTYTSRIKSEWLKEYVVGVRGDGINFSLSSNLRFGKHTYPELRNHFTTTLGFEIGNGKYLNKHTAKVNNELPIWMVAFGRNISIPFGKKSNAASAINYYLESKFVLLNRLSLGYKIGGIGSISYGYDSNGIPFDQVYTKDGMPTLPGKTPNRFVRYKNEISLIRSATLHSDYYFRRAKSWAYVGCGIGFYRSIGKSSWTETDDFGNEIEIPGILKENSTGFLVRFGQKVGIVNTGIEFNFIGKQLPNYLSINIGIEPGLTKRHVKAIKVLFKKGKTD